MGQREIRRRKELRVGTRGTGVGKAFKKDLLVRHEGAFGDNFGRAG